MKSIRIVLLGMAAAIAYGVLHDQVTARVCLEYFTVFHPPVFPTTNPTLLGLGWGIIATWWVGLPLGVILALAARAGSRRTKLQARELVRPVIATLLIVGLLAGVAGVCGWALASRGRLSLPPWLAARIPAEHQARFFAAWWAHSTSYLAGALGGLALGVVTWRRRTRANPAGA
jgi:hypothetical protein